MTSTVLASLSAALLLGSPVKTDIEAETRAWHTRRLERLTAEDGWLSLVGLAWLKPGDNAAGSGEGLAVSLPKSAPAQLGAFRLEGEKVHFQPAPGVAVTVGGKPFAGGVLRTDAEGEPDVVRWGSLRLHAIRRGERTGIRVRDSEAEARRTFHGIPTYPAQAKWRVEARLEPAKEARMLQVPTVMGTVEPMPSPGTLVFQLDGKEYRLDPALEGNQLFVIFADETNRTDTYGAGRFLYADVPEKDGKVVLDFNRAYNPPCAFSKYATCPLPPKQNRLKVRIEAGEKRVGDH
ncbi:MAG: DUF1684 domain-containing protein [Myxococcaceae bacterium]|nr:DUF1684 domain-containing protein [Myxococcaceae bacterium]